MKLPGINRPRMSWYEFSFEEYKNNRNSVFTTDLQNLRCPTISGLVSIVLPVYNGASMLPEAIESILAQTYQNFELICVDDGSTDGSGELLDRYTTQDPRIRVIHQENKQLPSSLSLGFSVASGEFRTWTSHDNRLKPFFLEKMVDCLQRHPDWDMAYANIDIIGENGELLVNSNWYAGIQNPPGSGHVHLPPNTGRLNTLPDNHIGAAFLYRDRVSYLLGDYACNRFTLEDYDYWMQVNSLLKLRHVDFDTPVYEYRFHSESLTARDEELGITRSRDKLFIFDSFRRDFYLSPVVWIVEQQDLSPEKARIIQELRDQIQQQGDILLTDKGLTQQYPRLWMPCIYLYVTSHPENHPPATSCLPSNAYRVLVALTDASLPDSVAEEWDVCVNWGNVQDLPKLSGYYQGWLQTNDLRTLMTALDILTRTSHLRDIEKEIANPIEPENKITVVVSTYQRQGQLKDTLESLANQSMPLQDYEVIVVNNDPSDEVTNQAVKEIRQRAFSACPDKLRLIMCPIPGLSHARNAGISEASGELICLIDDDAVADRNWLANLWSAYENQPSCGVLGGTIILEPPDPRPKALKPGWEPLWTHFIPDYKELRVVKNWFEFPWGTNWAAPRKLLLEIGGFRSQYGRRKRDFGGGEEVVAAILIHRMGYDVAIEPSAVVYHRPSIDRYTFKHVWKSTIQGTLVTYQIQKNLYLPIIESPLGNVKQIVLLSLKSFLNLMPWNFKPHDFTFTLLKVLGRMVLLRTQIRDYFYRYKEPDLIRNP